MNSNKESMYEKLTIGKIGFFFLILFVVVCQTVCCCECTWTIVLIFCIYLIHNIYILFFFSLFLLWWLLFSSKFSLFYTPTFLFSQCSISIHMLNISVQFLIGNLIVRKWPEHTIKQQKKPVASCVTHTHTHTAYNTNRK